MKHSHIQHHLWVVVGREKNHMNRRGRIYYLLQWWIAMKIENINISDSFWEDFFFAVLLSADLPSKTPNVNGYLSLVCVEKACLYSIRSSFIACWRIIFLFIGKYVATFHLQTHVCLLLQKPILSLNLKLILWQPKNFTRNEKKKKRDREEIWKSLLRFLFLTLHNIVLRPIKCYE